MSINYTYGDKLICILDVKDPYYKKQSYYNREFLIRKDKIYTFESYANNNRQISIKEETFYYYSKSNFIKLSEHRKLKLNKIKKHEAR